MSNAEVMYAKYEEVIANLQLIVDEFADCNEDSVADHIRSVAKDLIVDAKDAQEEYDYILACEDELDMASMNSDYERSVM